MNDEKKRLKKRLIIEGTVENFKEAVKFIVAFVICAILDVYLIIQGALGLFTVPLSLVVIGLLIPIIIITCNKVIRNKEELLAPKSVYAMTMKMNSYEYKYYKDDREFIKELINRGYDIPYIGNDCEYESQLVIRKPEIYKNISESVKSDIKFLFPLLEHYNKKEELTKTEKENLDNLRKSLSDILPQYEKNQEVLIKCVENDIDIGQYAKNLMAEYQTKDSLLEAIEKNVKLAKYCPSDFLNDKEFMMELKEFMMKLIEKNYEVAQYAPKEILEDKEFMLKAGNKVPECIEFASRKLRNNKEFMLEAIKLDGNNAKYCSDGLKANKEFMIEAIKVNGNCVQYASDEIRADKEFMMEAIEIDVNCYKEASDALKNDFDVAKLALKNGFDDIFINGYEKVCIRNNFNELRYKFGSEKFECSEDEGVLKYGKIPKATICVNYNELLLLAAERGSVNGAIGLSSAMFIKKASFNYDNKGEFEDSMDGLRYMLDYKDIMLKMIEKNGECIDYLIPSVDDDQHFWDLALKANPAIQEKYSEKWES